MHTLYEKLYDNLLPKFRSFDIPLMTVDEVKEQLHDYLIPGISRFHVCSKNLKDRNDLLERFNVLLSDDEIEIISNFMLLEYIDSTYVRTPTLLKVSLPSADFHAFSPANFLDKLLAMHERYRAENETLLARYAWLEEKGKKSLLNAAASNRRSKRMFDEF